MKKNAEIVMATIQKALSQLGSDFSLSKAKSYLIAAFEEIKHVNNKRIKRENNLKKETEKIEKKKIDEATARKKLQQLNQMLKDEESKLRTGVNQSPSKEN